jgi:hypothetical protein
MELQLNKAAFAVLMVIVLVIGVVAYAYLTVFSLYQVPSYSFKYGKFWTYTGSKTDSSPPDYGFVEVYSPQSVTFSDFYWQKYTKAASLWDVYWRAKTDLRLNTGVSGSELVQTYGAYSKNFTDSSQSTETETAIVETTWWIHRFKGYVYFTVTGSIEIQLEEYNPTWSPGRDDMEWICNQIQEWTRLKDSKIRFRIDAPDVLGQESDFHGIMGMWVKDYNIGEMRNSYGTAYVSPCEDGEEIVLVNENGEPLLWGYPYNYDVDSNEISNLAYNPQNVIPQSAYFDLSIVDLGSVPHWNRGYEGQWQAPDYDTPTSKLVFYVDVISTHHELFIIPDYTVPEEPPEAPGEYEPLPHEEIPDWVMWLTVGCVIAVAVVAVVVYAYRRKS